MNEKINYGGWPNCIRLFNEETELIVTTDIGPRIIRFGFIGKQNFFYVSPADSGRGGGSEWRIYGGHRLWLAPEEIDISYYPDNDPVSYTFDGNAIKVTQAKETTTGIVKEMEITLSPVKNQVTVLHRLINQSSHAIEVAPWSISALSQGGRAIIPQEPFGEGNDYLLPARSLALWQYTKMNDPRWLWGENYIQATQNPSYTSEQKIGLLNKQGWCAYSLNEELLIKKFDFIPDAIYPDYGSNNEIYINENFLEIETLGPLTAIPPAGSVEHIEHWLLTKAIADESEESIDTNILPVVHSFLARE
jgi:hypothetical protein